MAICILFSLYYVVVVFWNFCILSCLYFGILFCSVCILEHLYLDTDSPQSSRKDLKQMIFRATISKKRILEGIKKWFPTEPIYLVAQSTVCENVYVRPGLVTVQQYPQYCWNVTRPGLTSTFFSNSTLCCCTYSENQPVLAGKVCST